jgi:hypothetical protein
MVVMVPTQEFRQQQLRELPRAAAVAHHVSGPTRAQRNRLARDRLVAQDATHTAHRLGIHVIEVDGSRDAEAVADSIADHFARYLPPPEHRRASPLRHSDSSNT